MDHKPCVDVRDRFKAAGDPLDAPWEARRPMPPGKTLEQLTVWERHYYGRLDYSKDAPDYALYCRWFAMVRKKEECERQGDELPDGVEKELAYGEAIWRERTAASLLRAHVRATDPKEQEKVRLEQAEKDAAEYALREKERIWQDKLYELLKDCI